MSKDRICPRCKKPTKLADWARYKDGQLKHICKACQTPQERRHSRDYEPVTVSPKVLAQTLLQPVNGERYHRSVGYVAYPNQRPQKPKKRSEPVDCNYGSGVSMRGVK